MLFSSVLTAATVTREEARQLALRFLTEHGSGVAAARGMQPVPLLLRDAASVEQLHVFNVGQQEGFVIVSGDDCTGDLVLGYADSGEIAQETMPANLRAWLQGYADQIRWMQQHGVRNDVAAARALTSAARQPVASRMTCRWNQAEPYNMYCPLVNSESDERTVTGCEATAVAQVLYYHGMRLGGTTTTTKTIPGYTKGNYTIDDKEPYEFDWSKMEDSYAASDVSESAQEVARLMEYVGAGVYMKYNSAASGGSSANSEKIAPLLTEYFGYDKDAQLLIRNNYTYAEWVDLVYQELTQNGPVLYDGQSTGGGHIFVLDGYIDEAISLSTGDGAAIATATSSSPYSTPRSRASAAVPRRTASALRRKSWSTSCRQTTASTTPWLSRHLTPPRRSRPRWRWATYASRERPSSCLYT